LIVHVLCRDIPAATRLLNIATTTGYRESGISISSVSTPQEKVLVAIRTTAIRLDIPLASYNAETQIIHPLDLSQEYLIFLLKLVNDTFHENELRKQNLLETLRKSFTTSKVESTSETKEERRIKKRQEGLKRQAACNQANDNTAQRDIDHFLDVLDNTPSLDQLTTL